MLSEKIYPHMNSRLSFVGGELNSSGAHIERASNFLKKEPPPVKC
jgi:hypothetical protein